MKIISGNEFEETTGKGLVLVDFFADWCGPCKMLAPVLEDVAKEMPDVNIVKVNVDNDNEIAAKFNVMSIPTLVLFKDGAPIATTMGFQAKPQLIDFIKKGL